MASRKTKSRGVTAPTAKPPVFVLIQDQLFTPSDSLREQLLSEYKRVGHAPPTERQ